MTLHHEISDLGRDVLALMDSLGIERARRSGPPKRSTA
jgi:hypothetical protein